MWCSRWNEHCVSGTLRVSVAHHPILFVQPLPQLVVQVDTLVVNGIGVGLQLLALLQGHTVEHVPDLVGVSRVVQVPDSAHGDPGAADSGTSQKITVGFVYGFQA